MRRLSASCQLEKMTILASGSRRRMYLRAGASEQLGSDQTEPDKYVRLT